jgi:hypothetical protein
VGAAHFDSCDLQPPDGAFAVPAGTHVYDTDARMFTSPPANPASQVLTQPDGTDALLLSVTSLAALNAMH